MLLRNTTIFHREDLLLLILAAAGAVIFLIGYRTQLPESALRSAVPQQEIDRQIDAFLVGLGYDGQTHARRLEARRNTAVIDTLQRLYGRPAAVRMLKDAGVAVPPGLLWRSRYPARMLDRQDAAVDRPLITVSATPTGEIYAFSPDSDAHLSVDRSILTPVLEDAAPGLAEAMAALSRDAIAERVIFDDVPDVELAADDTVGGMIRLPSALAETMARAHLEHTYWGGRVLRADSVTVRGGVPGFTAEVVFVTEDNNDLPVSVATRVTAAGALQSLSSSVPVRALAADRTNAGTNWWSLLVSGMEGLVWVLISVLLIVYFLRRTGARAVDFGPAIKDGVLGALLMLVYFGATVYPEATMETGEFAARAAIVFGLLVTVALSGLYVFVLSGAADSAARDVWPEKLETVMLCRQTFFVNRPVGLALLRGSGGALVMVGVMMAVLWMVPGAVVTSENAVFAGGYPATHIAGTLSAQLFKAMVITALILGGVGSFLRLRQSSPFIAVGAVALLLAVLNIAMPELDPEYHEWLVSAPAAVVLAVLFWRYDSLAAIISLAVAGILWESTAGWGLGGPGAVISLAGGIVPLAAAFILGFVGVRSRRDGMDLPRYVPRYIEELAHQQHIERELDIARQVQRTFLPRKMPWLRGATVSALCIPAHEVGGDYYDFMPLDENRVAIVIGDVSGKGIQAAFYMTLVKGFVQTLCCETYTPLKTLERINYLFCRNAPPGTFVSLIFGIFDQRRGAFTFARAGHSPVIHKKTGSSSPQSISPSGIAVGLTRDERFRKSIREETIVLEAGDSLVLYTDGISEAVNRRNDQFGEERLLKAVATASGTRAEQVIDSVSIAVQNFARGVSQHDDMTMVVLKVDDGYIPSAPAAHDEEITTCHVDQS